MTAKKTSLPVNIFFRDSSQFTPINNTAMDYCKGRILDVGGGTGLHNLVLQQKGFSPIMQDVGIDEAFLDISSINKSSEQIAKILEQSHRIKKYNFFPLFKALSQIMYKTPKESR